MGRNHWAPPPGLGSDGKLVPATEGGVKPPDRRTVLMLMYVIGALKPDIVDPELQFLARCARKQWPTLVARQLYRAGLTDERRRPGAEQA